MRYLSRVRTCDSRTRPWFSPSSPPPLPTNIWRMLPPGIARANDPFSARACSAASSTIARIRAPTADASGRISTLELKTTGVLCAKSCRNASLRGIGDGTNPWQSVVHVKHKSNCKFLILVEQAIMLKALIQRNGDYGSSMTTYLSDICMTDRRVFAIPNSPCQEKLGSAVAYLTNSEKPLVSNIRIVSISIERGAS
jgi:hypothetical protein